MASRIIRITLLFQTILKSNLYKATKLLMVHTFFTVVAILYLFCTVSYAYDAGFHQTLSETTIKYSDNYINSLILSGLIDDADDKAIIEGFEPLDWIKRGSSSEDYIQIALGVPEIDIDLLIKILFAARKNGLIGLLKIAAPPV